MGEEKPAEWYTGKYTEGAMKRYTALYLNAIELIRQTVPDTDARIIDLGCGVGIFSQMLYEAGYQNYLGIDFSAEVIKVAKVNAPNQLFLCNDLRDTSIQPLYTGCTCFVCLEVLEHIKDDMAVLVGVPKGANLIFSLPTADAQAHVRRFKTKEGVYARYSGTINIQKYFFIRKRHLCNGIKR